MQYMVNIRCYTYIYFLYQIKNDSSKVIKYITVSVIQNAEIFLGTAADYDVTVVR